MALELKIYECYKTLDGDSHSTAIYLCEWSEIATQITALLGLSDALNSDLKCMSVRAKRLEDDTACGKAELTAECVPENKVDAKETDQPFKCRMEISGEAMTIKGGYHWGDGTPLVDTDVLPTKRFTTMRCVLFGVRSSFDYSTYSSYVDHVNSDVFKGSAVETVFFDSALGNERVDEDGNTVYDVEIHLVVKPSGWNKFIREGKAEPEELYQDGVDSPEDDKVYPQTAFADLLAAP